MPMELVNQCSLISNFIRTEYDKPTVIVEEAVLFAHSLEQLFPKMTFPDDAEHDEVAFFPCKNDDEAKDLVKKMLNAGVYGYLISSKGEVVEQGDVVS